MSQVAVVTGSNKGIGLAIVKLLATQNPTWVVYLTARDVTRGQDATKSLPLSNVRFHQLDITDSSSITALAEHLKAEHDGFDVLVNNAAIAYKQNSTAPFSEQAEVSIRTNFDALLSVCHELTPLLRPNGRVVHVASRSANSCYRGLSAAQQERVAGFTSPEDVIAWTKEFLQAAKADENVANGFGTSAYGMSKLAVVLVTPMMQAKLTSVGKDITVNCCCPNYISTDMTSNKGPLSVEFGADVEVYLATLPERTDIKGKFVAEREVISYKDNWTTDPVNGIVKA